MSTVSKNSDEKLRTIWTHEMDQYFIKLMLQQVRKGNKSRDHLFSKRAWKFMSSSFTSKFKFSDGKDVLKNRHKTLRNLFKSVNNFLKEDGFSWDESKEMVVADDGVWDEYLKVHSDLRCFRVKSLPCYKDLCLIYSEHKDEENIVEEEVFESSTIISNSKGRCRTTWNPPMDRYFIDLMLDQARRGNQIDGVFGKQSWIEMLKLFNTKFKSSFDIDVLKNRYKSLRRQFNAIKSLLRSDGFSWDDERQMVTADGNLWQEYIKAHRDARQFMTRPIPYYKDLCLLCRDSEIEDCLWFDPGTEFRELKTSEEEDHQQLCTTDDTRVRKKTRVDGIEDAVEAVQALPDMDEELILDACDLLEDEVKAKTFLALDVKLRKKWLLRKLRPQVNNVQV